jgi:hypothetical protein
MLVVMEALEIRPFWVRSSRSSTLLGAPRPCAAARYHQLPYSAMSVPGHWEPERVRQPCGGLTSRSGFARFLSEER